MSWWSYDKGRVEATGAVKPDSPKSTFKSGYPEASGIGIISGGITPGGRGVCATG